MQFTGTPAAGAVTGGDENGVRAGAAGLMRAALLAMLLAPLPAHAQTARDLLTEASFAVADKGTALARVQAAQAAADARLARAPSDREAALMQATALGYRAKLTGSRGEAVAARKRFEALVAEAPGDAERHLALGAWHVGAVNKLGTVMGRALLGASKPTAFAALERSIQLGGNRALFPGLAALLRLELDPGDARGRALAEAAARAPAPTPLDRHFKAAAARILTALPRTPPREVKALASRLLPFGRFD
jgi:hypothetical protein